MYRLTSMHHCREYVHTTHFFVNSYPWLFPSGVGDIYNLEQGEIPIIERGQHLLRCYDGRFLEDPLFGLFLYTSRQGLRQVHGKFLYQFLYLIMYNSIMFIVRLIMKSRHDVSTTSFTTFHVAILPFHIVRCKKKVPLVIFGVTGL